MKAICNSAVIFTGGATAVIAIVSMDLDSKVLVEGLPALQGATISVTTADTSTGTGAVLPNSSKIGGTGYVLEDSETDVTVVHPSSGVVTIAKITVFSSGQSKVKTRSMI